MRHLLILLCSMALVSGCGGGKSTPGGDSWTASPERVIEGIMHAYATRDDSLYAALLTDDFRYFFEPAGADSADILGWGKGEEVVVTGNLFRTPDVDSLSYTLRVEPTRDAGPGKEGWRVVPVSGGEMIVLVRSQKPMEVTLNRQEIVLKPTERGWQIIEWHDFPDGGITP